MIDRDRTRMICSRRVLNGMPFVGLIRRDSRGQATTASGTYQHEDDDPNTVPNLVMEQPQTHGIRRPPSTVVTTSCPCRGRQILSSNFIPVNQRDTVSSAV